VVISNSLWKEAKAGEDAEAQVEEEA